MTVRAASSDDIPELVRIINAAFRVEDFFVNGDRTDEADMMRRMSDPAVRFLVVDSTDSGGLAAAVQVDVHAQRGHFAMLAVDPELQGRGLSRVLMNAVEEYCRDRGCEDLDIEVVNLREELPAFYVAMGFLSVDTAPFPDMSKLRRDAHMVRMTKRLR
jgi:GNAT superfamily N-acetyltransferase